MIKSLSNKNTNCGFNLNMMKRFNTEIVSLYKSNYCNIYLDTILLTIKIE